MKEQDMVVKKKVNVIKDGFIILMEVLHSMIKKKF